MRASLARPQANDDRVVVVVLVVVEEAELTRALDSLVPEGAIVGDHDSVVVEEVACPGPGLVEDGDVSALGEADGAATVVVDVVPEGVLLGLAAMPTVHAVKIKLEDDVGGSGGVCLLLLLARSGDSLHRASARGGRRHGLAVLVVLCVVKCENDSFWSAG